MRNWIRPLSVVSSIGMFLVLLMGTLVTKTGSGLGCGNEWPLCNGKFVPAYTIESFIEYSHRFVTGIEGFFVVAVFVMVWMWVKRNDAKVYASLALFFTLLQAVLGAMAVLWPQSSSVLALHFGISLLAFSSTLLLVIVLRESSNPYQFAPKQFTALSVGFRWAVWFTTFYCYVVVYLGAYVRHTKSLAGCKGWPLCNGEVIPELSGATGIVFMHRAAAALLLILIVWLTYSGTRRGKSPKIRQYTLWALFLGVLQIVSGAFVTYAIGNDELYLYASMVHTVLIAGLFGVLSYLSVLMMNRGSRPNGV